MRADAAQNRQRLLDAAEDLFARKGTSVGVAEIVAAAGVGPPTLYRHFGTKDGLIAAISQRRSELAAANMARALAQPSGWAGLSVAIEFSVDLARTNRAVREQAGVPVPAALERMLLTAWAELVDRARAEGSVRDDVRGTDMPFVVVAVVAAALAADHDPRLRERCIALLMDGLRPAARAPLPGSAPSQQDVSRAFRPGH